MRLQAHAGGADGVGNSPSAMSKLPGFGKAKNVILLFLQGGPSHIDLWDPKPDAPENIRGLFKPIETKTKGLFFGEHMPKLAMQHRIA